MHPKEALGKFHCASAVATWPAIGHGPLSAQSKFEKLVYEGMLFAVVTSQSGSSFAVRG